MKSLSLLIACFFCVSLMMAQNPETQKILDSTAKSVLKQKLDKINILIDSIHKQKDAVKLLENALKDEELGAKERASKKNELEELQGKISKNDSTIIAKCKDFKTHKKYLKDFGKIEDSILNKFSDRSCILYVPEKKPIDYTKFIIIGDNEPIKKEDLLSNENTQKVLADVFSIDSKTNLGAFEIPGDGEMINLYVPKGVIEKTERFNNFKNREFSKKASDKLITVKTAMDTVNFVYAEVPKKAIFKSIQIELLEGGIVDSRLILESLDGKVQFYFEGTDPVSLLNYSRKAPERAVLKFSHYVSVDGNVIYNEKALRELQVKYTDVLDYHPNAGRNYVPDDVSYKFPSEKKEEKNSIGRRSYQIINNNHLQHVLDLRTYTDMLGLFGNEANGLFQIEGKADFFINPFNVPKTSIYWLKKVSPYVRYSRLDDDQDFIAAALDGNNMYEFENEKLELLERSNLEMGIETNFFNFRFAKESPFWMSFYIPFTYNVTRIQTDAMADVSNFKTLGYGVGSEIEIKRFNNFGLRFGYEVKGYSFLGDYSDVSLLKPEELITQAVRAEIFYYPGLDKSNSIFLRMRSVKDISPGSGDSFFQLQVGYRFTLGVGAIKAR